MAPNTRSRQGTADPANQEDRGESSGDNTPATPNRKDYFPSEPSISNAQRPPQRQQQWSRNSAPQQQWPRNTVLQPTNSTPPPNLGPKQQQQRMLPAPPGAKAYFGDPQDDDDEWQ
ncbi:hypothetical protein BDR22DRAFT_972815 [Usnea florida]